MMMMKLAKEKKLFVHTTDLSRQREVGLQQQRQEEEKQTRESILQEQSQKRSEERSMQMNAVTGKSPSLKGLDR